MPLWRKLRLALPLVDRWPFVLVTFVLCLPFAYLALADSQTIARQLPWLTHSTTDKQLHAIAFLLFSASLYFWWRPAVRMRSRRLVLLSTAGGCCVVAVLSEWMQGWSPYRSADYSGDLPYNLAGICIGLALARLWDAALLLRHLRHPPNYGTLQEPETTVNIQ